MTELRSHPAVFAGLMGGAAWSTPTLAIASPVEDVAGLVSESLVLQFVIGCAAGAALASGIVFVSDRVRRPQDESPEAEEEDDRWSSSSLNLMRMQEQEADDDPTGDLGRYRTGQITIDPAMLAVHSETREHRRPRHSARIASAHVVSKSPSRRTGRHFVSSVQQGARESVVEAAPALRGKHFAEAVEQARAQNKLVFVEARVPAHLSKPDGLDVLNERPVFEDADVSPQERAKMRLSELPVIESRYAKAQAIPVVPVNTEAEVYTAPEPSPTVNRHKPVSESPAGITGRIRLRVREVLASRLESNALDGVPIITRADGSANEVVPTWFDQTLVPALASLTGVNKKLEDTAVRGESAQEKVATPAPQATVDVQERSSYISRHVAEVNVGVFPERRSADELEHEDVWEEALAAMGEAIAQETPIVFQDVIGGPSTIDDPDGLEAPTGFIPFRVPAAHPEVVDTETYVDYLLRDELSHNRSQVLRRSSHAHLRVIEGGTGNLRTLRRVSDTGSIHTGRHFAPARLAQEA